MGFVGENGAGKQKSEAKRWEDNYNNLYNQHVKLKRSKGLEIG